MNKNKIINLILLSVFSIFLVNTSFATQNFSVNPTAISITTNISKLITGSIQISNTGNESLNLSISKIDLKLGNNTVLINLSKNNITNFLNQTSNTLSYNFTTGNKIGTYTGKIIILNTLNSSLNITIPLSIIVENQSSTTLNLTGANINIIGESSIITVNSDLGIYKTLTLSLKNTGNVNLTNIRFVRNTLNGVSSSDRISSSKISFDNRNFDLNVGDTVNSRLQIDIPTNIGVDDYKGTFKIVSNKGYSKTYTILLKISGNSADVSIRQSDLDVRSGTLKMSGSQGDNLRNYKFRLDNVGKIDVSNLNIELSGDLIEENTGKILPKSAVTLIPTNIDLRNGRTYDGEIRVNIPVNQILGNYYTDLRIVSQNGLIYDKIKLHVEVTGDIYIKNTNFNSNIIPGENFDFKITLKNKGTTLKRNVKITATIFNIDATNDDLIQATNTFILDSNQEKIKTLRFNIPKEASDGSHTLNIRIQYDNQEFNEVKDLIINRQTHNLDIKSYSVSPEAIDCDKHFYTMMKIQNLGKFDENVQISTKIYGTNVETKSEKFKIKVDEITQKNLNLDVTSLKTGNYEITQKLTYGGSLFLSKKTKVQILDCNEFGKIKINTTGIGNFNSSSEQKKDTFKIFGNNMKKSTVYLGSGLILITMLIIISLFFI